MSRHDPVWHIPIIAVAIAGVLWLTTGQPAGAFAAVAAIAGHALRQAHRHGRVRPGEIDG